MSQTLENPDPKVTQTPQLIFTPHLSTGRITLISEVCLSHGPGAEAEKKAISVPAAKQLLLPPITCDTLRHFRPALGQQGTGDASGGAWRGTREPGD